MFKFTSLFMFMFIFITAGHLPLSTEADVCLYQICLYINEHITKEIKSVVPSLLTTTFTYF